METEAFGRGAREVFTELFLLFRFAYGKIFIITKTIGQDMAKSLRGRLLWG